MSNADLGGDPPCWAHLTDDEGDDAALSDATLAQLVRGLADAVIVCNPDGVITFWNEAATRVFGWSADHAVGMSLDLIIPDKQRRAHWDGYQRVMESGVTKYGDDLLRVPSLHADGQRRSIAFTVSLLKDPGGAVTGIAAVVRDETERWAEERQLRGELSALRQEIEAKSGE